MKKVIAIPDLHFPFENKKLLKTAYAIILKEQPDVVVQLGDLYDMYALSRYPRNVNLMTAESEIITARSRAENFWATISKLAPKARLFQLKGNHCERLQKRITEKLPELLGILDFNYLWEFIKVNTIQDARHPLVIDGIHYIHGYLTGLGKHCQYIDASVVCGHSHRPGIFYKRKKHETIWELNCGHLVDTNSEPLSYTPIKITNWSPAIGIIDDYGPRVVHL